MDKYDYVITKPEMEEVLYHSGVHKYIDKYLGKNGKWIYKYKSKAQEKLADAKRYLLIGSNGKYRSQVVTDGRNISIGDDGKPKSYAGHYAKAARSRSTDQLKNALDSGRKRAKKKAIIDKFTKRQLQKAFPSGGKNAGYGKTYVTSFRTKTSKSRKDPFGFGGDQYDAKYLRNPRAGSTRGQGYSSSIGSADNNKATAKALRNIEAAKRSKKNRKAK